MFISRSIFYITKLFEARTYISNFLPIQKNVWGHVLGFGNYKKAMIAKRWIKGNGYVYSCQLQLGSTSPHKVQNSWPWKIWKTYKKVNVLTLTRFKMNWSQGVLFYLNQFTPNNVFLEITYRYFFNFYVPYAVSEWAHTVRTTSWTLQVS